MMDIEALAVNAVGNSISKTDNLVGYLDKYDRTPSWDGSIYVYKNNKKTKDNLDGVIKIQIKGISNSDFSKDKICYTCVEISDLENYFNDGGVIYFVVYINNNGDTKVYYANLLPLVIKRVYLDKIKKDQKTLTIELSKFPDNKDKKVDICKNFIINREKQRKNIINNLSDKFEVSNNYEITFATSFDPYEYLLSNENFIYGINCSGNINTINKVICKELSFDGIKCNINCGEKTFYTSYNKILEKNQVNIKIGQSFQLIIDKVNNKIDFKFLLNGTLKERIIDIDFFINIMKNKLFYFEDKEIRLGNDFNIDINTYEKCLEYLKNAKNALEISGFNGDLKFDNMTKKDFENLDNLIKIFVYKMKPIINSNNGIIIDNIVINNLKILLLYKENFNKYENNSNEYDVYNFFSKKFLFEITHNQKKYEISQFCLLKEEDLYASNINCEFIKSDITSIKYTSYYGEQLNLLVLRMLLVYDKNKNFELLNCSLYCVEYIIKNDENFIYMINKLQILKRMNKFELEEENIVFDLIDKNQNNSEILVALYTLLDNKKLANYYLDKIENKNKEIFMTYPIYNLLKGN